MSSQSITCYIQNNTSYALTPQLYAPGTGGDGGNFNDYHGGWDTYPTSTIPANSGSILAFKIEKSNGMSLDGACGWASYDLGNSQGLMYIMFNSPHDPGGPEADNNCYAYVVIQGYTTGDPASSMLNVNATLSGISLNIDDPQTIDPMTITVTVNNN